MMCTTPTALLSQIYQGQGTGDANLTKVGVIGAGSIGTAIVFGLLTQGISKNVVLVDKDDAATKGEMLDIENAAMYLENAKVSSSSDYESLTSSKVCVVAAGSTHGQSPEVLAQQNLAIFREIIPEIVHYCPNCILVVASSPVDIMSYIAWKLSKFSPNRVMGIGTAVNSARFRKAIANKLNVSANCCQGLVIGMREEGIPVWSSLSVSGVRLKDINSKIGHLDDPEDWQEMYQELVDNINDVVKYKGCSSWTTSLSVCQIVRSILQNTAEVFTVSTHLKGCRHGIDKDVFISLPCVITSGGISSVVRQSLSESEKAELQESADKMNVIQRNLKL